MALTALATACRGIAGLARRTGTRAGSRGRGRERVRGDLRKAESEGAGPSRTRWSPTQPAERWSLTLTPPLTSTLASLRWPRIAQQTPATLRVGWLRLAIVCFIGSSNKLDAFGSGVAARLFRLVPSVVLGACITLVVVAVTAWRVPELRKLSRL